MAATYIPHDHTKTPMSEVDVAVAQIRAGIDRLGRARAVLIALCNGSTDTAAHFAQLTALCGFAAGDYADANTAALNAFAEVDSLYSKLTDTTGTNGGVGLAIPQCCGKLGVV